MFILIYILPCAYLSSFSCFLSLSLWWIRKPLPRFFLPVSLFVPRSLTYSLLPNYWLFSSLLNQSEAALGRDASLQCTQVFRSILHSVLHSRFHLARTRAYSSRNKWYPQNFNTKKKWLIENTSLLFIYFKILLYMWVFCLHVCLCIGCVQCLESPEEDVRFPWLDSQIIVSHFVGAGSSGRIASTLNCWVISLVWEHLF